MKIHFTHEHTYHKGGIQSLSVCGLKSDSHDKNFIDNTIIKSRVNCKKCLQVLNKMNMSERKFCIAATNKSTNIRKCISKEFFTKKEAELEYKILNSDRHWKRFFKYPKVVKSPYMPTEGGKGWCH